jgi:hypothetical protein
MGTTAPAPLIEHVDWIVALDDDVRRNLLITQCYHDLSTALSPLLGPEDANWCTFATWASRTAGRFIREDEVTGLLRVLLVRSHPVHVTLAGVDEVLRRFDQEPRDPHESLVALARAIVEHVAEIIAAGNLTVFGELAPVFARAVAAWETGDLQGFAALVAGLKPGPSASGGQDLLRTALGHYDDAHGEAGERRRAELLLLANAEVGLHEQTRLQPFIAASIDAPVHDLVLEVLGEASRPVAHLLHPLADAILRLWEQICTRELMTLSLPDATLRLGHDLPAPRGEPLYPAILEHPTEPALVQLMRQYGADHPGTAAALDWARLSDRMRYIIDLFRSRQRDRALEDEPFPDRRRREILAGGS